MIEDKVYKELAEIRGKILGVILHRANISYEYHTEKIEELNKIIFYIAKKNMWEYAGIASKEDIIKLEVLENLLKDEN